MPWLIRVEPCMNGFLVILQTQTGGVMQWNCATPGDVCARVGEILGVPQPSPVPDAFWRAWEPVPEVSSPASDNREKWRAAWRAVLEGGQP